MLKKKKKERKYSNGKLLQQSSTFFLCDFKGRVQSLPWSIDQLLAPNKSKPTNVVPQFGIYHSDNLVAVETRFYNHSNKKHVNVVVV